MNIWPRASKSSRRLCSKREEMTNYCCRGRNGSEISAAATPVSEIKVPQGCPLAVCSSDLVQNHLEAVSESQKMCKISQKP